MYEYLGYTGGFFYIVCYFPQIYDIWYGNKNRINTPFFCIQVIAAAAMLSYAILNILWPILILNGLTLFFLLIILYGIKYKKFNKRIPEIQDIRI